MNNKPKTPRCDLDCLLYGNPTWDQVSQFFKDEEFDEEHYLIEAIEKHLLTQAQRNTLINNNLTIEKMLNGRCSVAVSSIVNQIFAEWNAKLGFKSFGF